MKKSEIGKAASKLTKKQFGEELSGHVRLTQQEIAEIFPKKSDREELARLTDIVVNAANDNQRKARLVKNISKVAGAVVHLVKRNVVPV